MRFHKRTIGLRDIPQSIMKVTNILVGAFFAAVPTIAQHESDPYLIAGDATLRARDAYNDALTRLRDLESRDIAMKSHAYTQGEVV